ncbi:MAG: PQQ-binding-like beta-propeller repeat protein [Anaerolineae bacterium]|nr:PQQ-binding-like beta-propeller repeat protein [Anaerolineae bacterium]
MKESVVRRQIVLLALLLAIVVSLSGCAGGAQRATSWPGLTFVADKLFVADITNLQALEAADAAPIWSFPVNTKDDNRGTFVATPAVTDEYVIAASEMPRTGFFSQPTYVVWAVDRETGRDVWSFSEAGGTYVEGGAVSDGIVVIGNSDGYVYALDLESGALKWKFETGHRVWASPLIDSGVVFIGSMDRHLYALSLADGSVIWDFNAGGAFAGTPVLQDGVLFIGAFNDMFYALDAETGQVQWSIPSDNWFWGGPVIYGDIVYAADVQGNVHALDAGSGATIWIQTIDSQVRASPAISEDGALLLVGSEDGNLYALATADGFVVWVDETEGQVLTPPVVNGSIVYEVLTYGTYRVRALRIENGREIWSYPPQIESQ